MLPFSLFFLLLLTSALPSSSSQLNRRILHQPFFPQNSSPPSQPPNPSPPAPSTADIPFTPANDSNTPFFPIYPSPPPAPAASVASFPANISSIIVPDTPKPRRASSKLVAGAIAAVLAAVILLAVVVFLHFRRRRRARSSSSDTKTQRSDTTSVRPSYANNGNIPKLTRPSQTSSEFLYLGTLVNTHGAIDNSVMQQHPRSSSTGGESSAANSRKFDSPELRPLPPLYGHNNVRRNYGNAEAGSTTGEDGDEFYSPRGSLGGRESSIGTGSASRGGFPPVEVENMGHSSSTSSSSSSTGSDSPVRSVSPSISPPASLSPKISRPKSPELVALETVPHPGSPPPPMSFFDVQLAQQRLSKSPSPTLSRSPSPSPPRSPSPERVYTRSRESSPRMSDASDHDFGSPLIIPRLADQKLSTSIPTPTPPPPTSVGPASIPPPPPPPPPPSKYWESPRTPTPVVSKILTAPPALVTPLRPLSLESPTLISPMELPGNAEPVEKDEDTFELRHLSNENVEQSEEALKPKLKPLHWDKVRASSDREMVWDQLQSSSFK